ncbi:thioredoxin domain-containing protein 3 isoform X1 [Hylobates moloch]|uniref:thioredoxin domain-containing protein 3 isoform X1 n=1 Tax=Hylobates moloch TaxID=81572 RepID=UPI0013F1D07C|nr:thioredoxin domain-containing protein 3 isoform X1 [Hylobates moloch]XP_058288558.1 thioredoxin domain-containing protein 3 isoform X1 [Hylobates moloch]XP_058288578.1 thioredoxin domain-containing protein 3 isoform X1 [Hylobates moloch]XP_058288606.1 thioredoxin domain-containing protein 3 isoform X1 [Hylobates moloch]XP_058288643.1 thioredoxin domain-containing protein 3 isoform X1 [Hylobates moloch]
MASKKQEVQLQTVINNQSLWDEMLQNKGLTVIDVYQAWCGPCKAMQPLFRKLKNELNEDEILHFAVAEADNIVTLQPFRDKCEPVFLFSVNGKIIAKIQGANAPLVNKKVINLIDEERKIAAGEMARPQHPEIPLVDSDSEVSEESPYESVQELYSIAIIKPDAVISRKGLEIKRKITKAGFIIEAEHKTVLTEEQVVNFYSRIGDQADFEEFVSFMTSGLSYILVVSQGSKPNPPSEETEPQPDTEHNEPSEDQPEVNAQVTPGMMKNKRDSLQEYLERQHVAQFCDLEEDATNVTKFMDIFFPDFKKMKSMKLEKTLALLRPNLFHERKDDVLHIIKDEDFNILEQRQVVLSEKEAQALCKEYKNEDYFNKLIENMTSGPSLALVLLRDNGLQYWKQLLGPRTAEEAIEYFPESLCAKFAMDSLPVNQLYGSDSLETAEREIQHFFPLQSTLGLIKPHATSEQREQILKMIKEAGFDLTQVKKMFLTPEQIEKIYPKITGKDFYKDLLEMLSEGPSMVMILTKWNAVAEWRRLMGPTDPEEAKVLSPDSIRARFGISKLKNIVHGASNVYEAKEVVNRLFENPEEN